jgi:hypothetical protein
VQNHIFLPSTATTWQPQTSTTVLFMLQACISSNPVPFLSNLSRNNREFLVPRVFTCNYMNHISSANAGMNSFTTLHEIIQSLTKFKLKVTITLNKYHVKTKINHRTQFKCRFGTLCPFHHRRRVGMTSPSFRLAQAIFRAKPFPYKYPNSPNPSHTSYSSFGTWWHTDALGYCSLGGTGE